MQLVSSVCPMTRLRVVRLRRLKRAGHGETMKHTDFWGRAWGSMHIDYNFKTDLWEELL
jgi:hypothetical protein